jgi:hypothetical protein
VVRFTAQKELCGLGSLSITSEWVALVYPVRKRLVLLFVFIMLSGFCFFLVFLLFLFVFFLYPFYQVLWVICFGVVNFPFSASFAA